MMKTAAAAIITTESVPPFPGNRNDADASNPAPFFYCIDSDAGKKSSYERSLKHKGVPKNPPGY